MGTPEQLRALITAQPFEPFLIRMAGGRVFTVRHPENAACDFRGRHSSCLITTVFTTSRCYWSR